MREPIEAEQFFAADIRVGTVLSAERNERARHAAYVLTVDFGEELGTRQTSAQLAADYELDELVGQQVAAVVNFPPKQVAGVRSEVLVLAAVEGSGRTILLRPEREVEPGATVA